MSAAAAAAKTVGKQNSAGVFFMRMTLQFIFFAFYLGTSLQRVYRKATYMVNASTGHHHRSPQLIRSDISKLNKVPEHISVILTLQPVASHMGGIQGLLHQTGEITGWCIGAGSKELTIYERTGALQQLPLQDVVRQVKESLEGYFGVDGVPGFEIRRSNRDPVSYTSLGSSISLRINLLSEEDGRPVIVKLAKQFSLFSRENKINPEDITVNLVDREMQELVGREPDLIVMFSPRVDLQGFPPWHIRVSEIFYLPDNEKVSYLVFKRALEKFSGSKINLGK